MEGRRRRPARPERGMSTAPSSVGWEPVIVNLLPVIHHDIETVVRTRQDGKTDRFASDDP
ncbi:MAG: hypothetical protein AVDCRST_MAG73-1709 [uncultured Thermomicrobiales bacterium]|uniref:Uncharacterized protein n=1 Tax=uncultured Thermomicrobiales bacterium TaxID=1645740 RepID=A0A6J4U4I0_9BACT|nr:MAG: hypothetical protein AVDCRST_MAG73-1709 [uncultured Thermomicrobiales bacterium]